MRDSKRATPEIAAGTEHTGDRLIGMFLLGAVLLHPLLIGIFDAGADGYVLGIPLLFVYLFAVWALLIIGLALALRPDDGRRRPRPPVRPLPPTPGQPPLPPWSQR